MTDNVPAVRQPDPVPAREITRTETDSWIPVLQNIGHLAELICGTEFVPKNLRNSAPATAAAIMYGREVGLPPMTALTQTHVIEGRPAMSAEAMRALVVSQGHELVFDEATGAICTMRARRHGSDHWTTLSWTIDAARSAKLLNKDNWQKYPRAMLVARCTADICRMVFPDVIHGFRGLEEMEDVAGEDDGSGAAPSAAQGSTTKVGRKRTTKKAAATPRGAAPTPELAGPPLPGEPGFDAPGGGDPAPESGESPRPDSDATSADGADDEPPTSEGEASEGGSGNTEDPSADVVDAETVDEPADAHTVDGPNAASGSEQPDAAGEAGLPESQPASPPSPRKPSRPQMRMLMASLTERGIDPNDREERLLVASKILGFQVESFDDLSGGNASTLIDTLARTSTRKELWALLDAIDEGGQS